MSGDTSVWAVHSGSDRGQLVLVAALALALALVALGIAYLQLGYHDDIETTEQEPAKQLESVLEQSLHNASTTVPETYHWGDRDDAVQEVRDELNTTRGSLETSRLSDGHVYQIAVNETHVEEWVTANCPDDANRQFGDCESLDGVAVQERNDRTHVLAVAFDLTITTPDGDTAATIVIEIRAT